MINEINSQYILKQFYLQRVFGKGCSSPKSKKSPQIKVQTIPATAEMLSDI